MCLRRFLKALNDDLRLTTVKKGCSTYGEIAAHIRKTCDISGPAILFPNPVRGSSQYESAVVGGVYANPNNVKRVLAPGYSDCYSDAPNVELVQRYAWCANITNQDELEMDTFVVDEPLCQKVVFTGSKVDLDLLPICHHNEKDAGRFITAGVQVVKWIDNKTMGLGIHRMMQVEKNILSCLAPPNRRVGFPHYEASKQGKGVPIAICIGAPPEVVLASQAKVNSDCEKYIIAARLQGKNLQLAKCITSDLLVPAECEIVIEGETIPESIWDDTPFGEYPGTYSTRSNSFLVRVNAITMQHDAMYQTILTGKVPQEDSNLCAIPYAAEVYAQATKVVETVTDISVFLGNNVFDTVICIDKKSNEQVQNLMHLLLGNKYLKSVTVMDRDLVADEASWRFAFNTRYQPNRDTIITGLTLGASLDPSSPLFQSTSKIAMDFTIPIGKTEKETEFNRFRHSIAEPVKMNVSLGYLHDGQEQKED